MISVRVRVLAALGMVLLLAAACDSGTTTDATDEAPQADATPAAESPEAVETGDAAGEMATETTAASRTEPATEGAVASVPDSPEEGVTADEVLIGWMGDATGPTASAQAFNLEGSRAAVAYYNAQGGVLGRDLVLVDRDDQFSAETAVTNYQGLLNDDQVLALVQVGGAHISEALMPNIEADQIPLIGPPQTIDVQLGNPYVFNNIAHYSDQADVAVEFMLQQVGSPEDLRVAVVQLELPSGDEWNGYVQGRLEDRGATYVDRVLMATAGTDFAGIAVQVQQLAQNQGVNYLALAGAPAHGLGVFTEMQGIGLDVPIVGIHGIAGTTIYEQGPPEAAESVNGIHSFLPSTSECDLCATIREYAEGTDFEAATREINFSHGWLDIFIAIQAIERAAESGELSRASLHEALQGEFDTGGLSCPIDWSESNHSPCAAPFQWQGDRIDVVGSFEEWAAVLEGEYGS